MKEHPILFSAPMVRALLEGRKTQTRRILKVPHKVDGKMVLEPPYDSHVDHARYRTEQDYWELWGKLDSEGRGLLYEWGFKCPYGKIGDRLWVRETFSLPFKRTPTNSGAIYRADADDFMGYGHGEHRWSADMKGVWKPSIFMPRWASRITLEVTDVRIQPLQDISNNDAKAEGVDCAPHRGGTCGMKDTGIDQCAICPYRDLWKDINGPKSWDENPWVWALSFRKV